MYLYVYMIVFKICDDVSFCFWWFFSKICSVIFNGVFMFGFIKVNFFILLVMYVVCI